MSSIDPQTDQPLDLKQTIEKVTSSNAYCWAVLLLAIAGAIILFVYHHGVPYSDNFFLVLAILAIAMIVNINQLRKNYLKKRDKPKQ